ncbi:MAG: PD40 domain-containing protein [Armatimonadetes bacterium]|nr:PD40 domain-containing protein [Armatimonadota bacterium]
MEQLFMGPSRKIASIVLLLMPIQLLAAFGDLSPINVPILNTPNGSSTDPALSADGRVFAFASKATNIVFNSGAYYLIFAQSVDTNSIHLVSTGDNPPSGDSRNPSISADGRYVAFQSTAGLVAGTNNKKSQIYVRDLYLRRTYCVSKTALGILANSDCSLPAISADGQKVAFLSYASNLDGTGSTRAVFVADLPLGTVELVSKNLQGLRSTSDVESPSISADGYKVSFVSSANDLVAGDANGFADVFVRDLLTKSTTLGSLNSDGTQIQALSFAGQLSGDGKHLVFMTSAKLASEDRNFLDWYIRDLTSGALKLVTATSAAISLEGPATTSRNGKRVMFTGASQNVTNGDAQGNDTFCADLENNSIVKVSSNGLGIGTQGTTDVTRRFASDDAATQAIFLTSSKDFDGKVSDFQDIYFRDLGSGTTRRLSIAPVPRPYTGVGIPSSDGNKVLLSALGIWTSDHQEPVDVFTDEAGKHINTYFLDSISDDWTRLMIYSGSGSGSVPGEQIVTKDLPSGQWKVASSSSQGAIANSFIYDWGMTSDGKYGIFVSSANNLVPDNLGGMTGAYLKDLSTGAISFVSRNADNQIANYYSRCCAISKTGRYIAFTSPATNLTSEIATKYEEVFIKDLVLGWVKRVPPDQLPASNKYYPMFSRSERFVYFGIGNDPYGGSGSVYRYDMLNNKVQYCFSCSYTDRFMVALGQSDRYVYFETVAKLTAEDTDTKSDIYLWDSLLGTYQLVDYRSPGKKFVYASRPVLDPTGSYLVFLAPAFDPNGYEAAGSVLYRMDVRRFTLTGVLSLADYAKSGELMSVEVYKNGELAEHAVANLTSDFNYETVINTTGDLVLKFKFRKCLVKAVAIHSEPGTSVIRNVTLVNGDVDGDNAVTIFDYLAISDYYGKRSKDSDWNTIGPNGVAPADADIFSDESVEYSDYQILLSNFDRVGD